MALFESYERRIPQIEKVCAQYGIKDLDDAKAICEAKGIDAYSIAKAIQPICFENVCWAYVLGVAIALKKGCKKAADAAKAIGEGLQAFCIPGSVADDRKVGLGHGNLASMLLSEETKCFAFWPVTNRLRQPKAPSGLPRMRTKSAKNRFASF